MRNCAIVRAAALPSKEEPAPESGEPKPLEDTCNDGDEGEEEEDIMDDEMVEEAEYC